MRGDRLKNVSEFPGWLNPCGAMAQHAFLNRRGVRTPHSFTFMAFVDLDGEDRRQTRAHPQNSAVLAGHGPSRRNNLDVFCLVKTYMRDVNRQQAPVLRLPVARANLVTRAPNEVPPSRATGARRVELKGLKDLCPAWGRFAAVPALADLCQGTRFPVAGPGWLGVDPEPPPR